MAKEKPQVSDKQEVAGQNSPRSVGRTSIGDLYHKIHHMRRTTAEQPVITLPDPTAEPSIPAARVSPEEGIERSRRMREEIWKVAEANAAFYEEMALKDELRQPWFHYLKHAFQYGEFVLLTPEMAEELLRYNPDNRNLKPWLTAAYRRDMDNDNWIPSHEGIGVNLSGNMFDGQHRAEAVVEAKKAVPIWVVFNVLDEAKFVADSGAKRNVNEKLAMVCNTRLQNRTAGMVKAMMRGTTPRTKFSEAEIATFAVQYQGVIDWMGHHLPVARADVQAAMGKAYLWFPDQHNILEGFCTRMREAKAFAEGKQSASPNWTGDNDPAKTLFFYLKRLKDEKVNNPISTYKKTLAAIEAELQGKEWGKAFERKEDFFHWEIEGVNYRLPAKS